jgi:hypothetical protein
MDAFERAAGAGAAEGRAHDIDNDRPAHAPS